MPAYRLLRAILIGLAVVFASAAYAQTWPATWTPLPGYTNDTVNAPNTLNDPLDYYPPNYNTPIAAQYDFVGDQANPGGYYSFDSSYVYFRMRINSAFAPTYGDQYYIYLDLPGSTFDYKPDNVITWSPSDVTGDPPTSGVRLWTITNDPNQGNQKWDWVYLNTSTDMSNSAVTTSLTTSTFGGDYDYFVDWAISYADLAALENATFRFQFASGPHPWEWSSSKKSNLEDVAEYEDPDTNRGRYDDAPSWAQITTPEPASMALTLLVLGIAGGAVRRRKAKADSGPDQAA